MTKRIYTEIQVPFSGFYGTIWSGMVDSAEEQEIEHFVNERQAEDNIPEELRLDESEYGELLYKHSNYKNAYRAIAADYVEQFSERFKEETGIDLGLKFKAMESPREYNFTTDRIFADIPVSVVRKLVGLAKRMPEKFGKRIERRHRSRDGFHSFYSWDLQEWLAKSWRDYDHNELQTVLETIFGAEIEDSGEFEMSIYYGLGDYEYEYYSDCVDWPKVEADIEELRQEKLAEIQAENPEYVPPYRCPETPDLFNQATR